MVVIKKQDFVEIEYTGRTKEDNSIFDTTEEKAARDSGVYDKHSDYSPAVICVGENNMPMAFEESLIGKETGKEYAIEINSERAFGKKDAKLIQMIPESKFRQQKIQPVSGLQLNIDGVFGIVRSVSGGRILVDFNHPLAGKDLIYNVKINRIVDDDKEKLKSLLKTYLGIKDAEIEAKEGSASIKAHQDIPKEAQDGFKKVAQRIISSIKNIDFTIVKEKYQNLSNK